MSEKLSEPNNLGSGKSFCFRCRPCIRPINFYWQSEIFEASYIVMYGFIILMQAQATFTTDSNWFIDWKLHYYSIGSCGLLSMIKAIKSILGPRLSYINLLIQSRRMLLYRGNGSTFLPLLVSEMPL